MDFLKQILNLSGQSSAQKQLDSLIAQARQADYAEDDLLAFEHLREASELAERTADAKTRIEIKLQQIVLMIRLQQLEQAALKLEELKPMVEANARDTACWHWVNGLLAHQQADSEAAREAYQTARDMAQEAGAAQIRSLASGFLAGIYIEEGNASYAMHLLKESLTLLDTSGDLDYGSHFAGCLGEAYVASGQIQEGEHLIERALRIAERLGQNRYIRRWRLALGDIALNRHHYDAAYEQLTAALDLFLSAQQNQPIYIQTLCKLSEAALFTNRPNEALTYAQTALAHLENTEGDLSAQVQAALGLALYANGQLSDAQSQLEQAISSYKGKTAAADQRMYVNLLRYLAAIQSKTDTEAALRYYEQALTQAETHSLSRAEAQVATDLGRIYVQQENYDDAIRCWKRAVKVYEAAHDSVHTIRIYCDMAQAQMALGQETRAMRDIEQALMLLSSIDDPQTRGLVLSNAGMLYAAHGEVESAEQFMVESIQIAKELHDPAAEAIRRGNYGWMLVQIGRAQRAMIELKTAHQLSVEHHLHLQAAIQTDNLGLAELGLGNVDAALEKHQNALSQAITLGNRRWASLFRLHSGQVYFKQGQISDAKSAFEAALADANAAGAADCIMLASLNLAQLALHEKAVDAAAQYLKEARQRAQNYPTRQMRLEMLIVASQFEAAVGKPDEARTLWAEAEQLYHLLNRPKPALDWLHQTSDVQQDTAADDLPGE